MNWINHEFGSDCAQALWRGGIGRPNFIFDFGQPSSTTTEVTQTASGGGQTAGGYAQVASGSGQAPRGTNNQAVGGGSIGVGTNARYLESGATDLSNNKGQLGGLNLSGSKGSTVTIDNGSSALGSLSSQLATLVGNQQQTQSNLLSGVLGTIQSQQGAAQSTQQSGGISTPLLYILGGLGVLVAILIFRR